MRQRATSGWKQPLYPDLTIPRLVVLCPGACLTVAVFRAVTGAAGHTVRPGRGGGHHPGVRESALRGRTTANAPDDSILTLSGAWPRSRSSVRDARCHDDPSPWSPMRQESAAPRRSPSCFSLREPLKESRGAEPSSGSSGQDLGWQLAGGNEAVETEISTGANGKKVVICLLIPNGTRRHKVQASHTKIRPGTSSLLIHILQSLAKKWEKMANILYLMELREKKVKRPLNVPSPVY